MAKHAESVFSDRAGSIKIGALGELLKLGLLQKIEEKIYMNELYENKII